MTLSEFKTYLKGSDNLDFVYPDGNSIPSHFHITEAGLVTKHFIDCGGNIRTEKRVTFQIWVAEDYDHRLNPGKLLDIIAISQEVLGNNDLEIEIEYQTDTIGKYGLEYKDARFVLTPKQTDCLAKDNCKVPDTGQVLQGIKAPGSDAAACMPGNGCC